MAGPATKEQQPDVGDASTKLRAVTDRASQTPPAFGQQPQAVVNPNDLNQRAQQGTRGVMDQSGYVGSSIDLTFGSKARAARAQLDNAQKQGIPPTEMLGIIKRSSDGMNGAVIGTFDYGAKFQQIQREADELGRRGATADDVLRLNQKAVGLHATVEADAVANSGPLVPSFAADISKRLRGTIESGMLEKDPNRVTAAADAGGAILGSGRALDVPGMANLAKSARDAFAALTDPSISLSATEVSGHLATVRTSVTTAVDRLQADLANQMRGLLEMLQLIKMSENVSAAMKKKSEELEGLINELKKKMTDVKELEKAVGEIAAIKENVEKLVTETIETVLKDLKAPEELVAAMKTAAKFLASADQKIRERGKQLMELGMTFLKNKDLLLSPENKQTLDKLMGAVKQLADEKIKFTDEMFKKLSLTITEVKKEIEKAASTLRAAQEKIAQELGQGIAILDKWILDVGKNLGNKTLTDAMSALRAEMEKARKKLLDPAKAKEVTDEQLKKLSEGFAFLRSKLESLAKMPTENKEQVKDRDNLATMVGNALGSYVKDAKSELSKMLGFLTNEYERAAGAPAYKSFVLEMSSQLAAGKKKIEDAKKEIGGRLLAEGARLIDRVNSELKDSKFADLLKGFFPPEMREKPETVSVETLERARVALTMTDMALKDIAPQKDQSIKDAAMGMMHKALELLGKGQETPIGTIKLPSIKDPIPIMPATLAGMAQAYSTDPKFRNEYMAWQTTRKKEAKAAFEDAAALRKTKDIGPEMKAELEKINLEAEALSKRLEAGEMVTDEEYAAVVGRFKFAENAIKRLEETGLEGTFKVAASRLFARGLDAMAKKDPAAADLHAFMANEFVTADATYQRQLSDWSAKLASGEIKPAELVKKLGERFATNLERSVGYRSIKNPAILAPLKAIIEKAKKETASQGDLNTLKAAGDYVKDYNKQQLAAKDPASKEKVDQIFTRAFDALQKGIIIPANPQLGTKEIDYAALQATLGRHRGNPPLSFAHKAEDRRAEIDSASEWLDQTVSLLDFHAAVVQSGGKMEEARKIFGSGPEAAAKAAEIEKLYMALGKDEKERNEVLAARMVKMSQMSELTGTLEKLGARRAEMEKKFGKTSVEASVYDQAMDVVERTLSKLYKGEKVDDKELMAAKGVQVLHFGNEQEIGEFFAPGQEAVMLRAQLAGCANFYDVIKGKAQEDREGIVGFLSATQDYLLDGKKGEAMAAFMGMNAYAKATNWDDKMDITAGLIKIGDKQDWQKSVFYNRMQIDRAEAIGKVKDPAELKNVVAYYDMAVIAFDRGDLAGADKMVKLANLYAGAVSKKDEPGSADAIKLVHRMLGDHSGNKELDTRRMRDIAWEDGDQRKWTPAELPGIAGRAILGKTSFESELGKEEATEADKGTAAGEILGLPKERRMDALSVKLAPLEAGTAAVVPASEILGSSEKEKASISAAYTRESTYHLKLSEAAEKGKDPVEAARQKREAEGISVEYMEKQVGRAQALREEGLKLIKQASDLKMKALSSKDPEEVKRLDEEASKLAMLGTRLVDQSESAMKALKSLHLSITTMKGEFREVGRWRYRDAAEELLNVGEELLKKKSAEMDGRQAALVNFAGRATQVADVQIAREKEILKVMQQKYSEIAKLEKEVKEHMKKYGDLKWSGPKVTFMTPGGLEITLVGGKLISDEGMKKDLANARGAVGARRFKSVPSFTGKVSQQMANDRMIAQVIYHYDELKGGFTEEERQSGFPKVERWPKYSYTTGVQVQVGFETVGYDFKGILGTLFDARNHVYGGRLKEARESLEGLQTRINLGYQTQRKLNDIHRNESLVPLLTDMEKSARSFGKDMIKAKLEGLDKDITDAQSTYDAAEKRKGELRTEIQDMNKRLRKRMPIADKQALRAERDQKIKDYNAASERADKAEESKLMKMRDRDKAWREEEVVNAIHKSGAPGMLADKAKSLNADVGTEIIKAKGVLQDLVDNGPIDPEKLMGPQNFGLLLAAVGETSNWDAEYYRRMVRQGKVAEAYSQFLENAPQAAKQALEHLATKGVMIDGKPVFIDRRVADYGITDVGSMQVTRRVDGFQRGYAITMGALGQVLKQENATSGQELVDGTGGGKGAWFMRIRFDTSKVLQFAVAASMDPEHIADRIEKGDRVYMPGVRVKIRDRVGSYDDAYWESGAKQMNPQNLLYEGVNGFLDSIQHFSVGSPVSMSVNYERQKQGQPMIFTHPESIALANVIVSGMLARGGLAWSDTDKGYIKVPLTKVELEAINELMYGKVIGGVQVGGYDELFDRFVSVGMGLGSVWSYSERKLMFKTVGKQASVLENGIAVIVNNAKDRQAGIITQTDKEIAEGMKEVLKQVSDYRTTHIKEYDEAQKAGTKWESYGRAITAVGELVAAGLLTATGFGTAVGVAFGVKALYELKESSRKAGGYQYLSGEEKFMLWGGVAMGFGGAALGELGAIANESMALTRSGQQAALVFTTEAVAAGRMTTTAAQEINTAARIGWIARTFNTATGVGTKIGGIGMMTFGTGMASYGLYKGYQAWRANPEQMTGFEFFATGVLGFAQATMPLGGTVMPTRFSGLWQSKGVGGKIFRGSMMFLTGETRGAVESAHFFAAREKFFSEFNKMPESHLKAYAAIEKAYGRPLGVEEGIAVMNMLPAERNKKTGDLVSFKPLDAGTETKIKVEALAQLEAAPRIAALAEAYQAHTEGKLNQEKITELGLTKGDQALFSKEGPLAKAKPEEAQKLITALALTEARANQLERGANGAVENAPQGSKVRAAELAEAFKLFLNGTLDDAAAIRLGLDVAHMKEFNRLASLPHDEVSSGLAKMAVEDSAPAGKRMSAEEAYAFRARKNVLAEAGAKVEKTGERPVYKVGDKEQTQEHVEAAADVSAAAESMLRKAAKGEPVTKETAKAELAKLAPPGAEISDAKVDAAIRLAQNEEFQKATAGGDRKTQLELGLDASYAIPEVRVSKDAVNKMVSKEAQEHIQNPALSPSQMLEKANTARKTGEHFRRSYEANVAKANTMAKDSLGRQKLEVIAERQKLLAEAYEANAKALEESAQSRAKQESGEFGKEVGGVAKDQAPKLGLNEGELSARAKELAEGRELYRLNKLTEDAAAKLGFGSRDEANKFYGELDKAPTGGAEKLVAKAANDIIAQKKFNDDISASIIKQTVDAPENVRGAAIERGKNLAAAYDAISKGMPDAEVMAKFGLSRDEVIYIGVRHGLEPAEMAADLAALAVRPEIIKTSDVGNAIGSLSVSAVRGSPKVYVERLTKYLEQIYGKGKVPPELLPRDAGTLYDTMKASAPALKKVLEGVRKDIGFERDLYAGFLRLNAEMQKGQEAVDALSMSPRIGKEPQEVGVIVFDGAKTWMKNGLGFGGERYQVHDRTYNGFEVGDFGLIVYMEAARRFAKENPEIYTKLQTAEGDEVVCIIPKERLGADPKKVISEYEGKFRETLSKVAQEMGVSKDSPLFAALADVNAHGGTVNVKTKPDGARTFTHEGKDYATLDGALVGLEVGHSLTKLSKKEGGAPAAKAIEGFIGDVLASKPQSEPVQLSQARKQGDVKVDAYATFRIGFEGGMGNNVKKLAENNGKGVTHVENGLAGPSVVNQMGHPVTDSLTAHFQDALVQALKARGLADKVEIYVDGPMTFAFKFKGAVDMNEIHAAVKEAGANFPKMMKERGVEGVQKATVASTHVEPAETIKGTVREVVGGKVNERDYTMAEKRNLAEKKAKDRVKEPIVGEMFKYRPVVRGANGRLSALISDAHLFYRYDETSHSVVPDHSGKSVLREALTDSSGKLMVDETVMVALEKVASKKWIRTPEDLIGHLRTSGVKEEHIEAFFRLLGFERIVAAKEEMAGMNPGKVFKGVANEGVEQVILQQAVGAEGQGPPPGKPPTKMPEEAPSGPRPAPGPQTAKAELEGAMGITLASGQEATYRLPPEPGKPTKEYTKTQMEMARDIAMAAEQIILTGKVPPGTKPEIELAAKGLAANEGFKAATPLQGQSNRKDQMKLALEATDARPEFVTASKAKDAAAVGAASRGLLSEDQRAASLAAEKLSLEYQRYQSGARDMDKSTLAFFESIREAPDAAARIGDHAAAEVSKKRLMSALDESLKDTTRSATGRAIPEQAQVEERAKKLAEAYHEYSEAQRIPDLGLRSAKMKEIATKLGVNEAEFNADVKPFFESLNGQSAHGAATRISNASLEGVRANAALLKPGKGAPPTPAQNEETYRANALAKADELSKLAPADKQAELKTKLETIAKEAKNLDILASDYLSALREAGVDIKVTTFSREPRVLGMLTGDLPGMISRGEISFENVKIPAGSKIVGAEYRDGAQGALVIKVRTPEGKEVKLIAKAQDLTADRVGAKLAEAAGIPAPEIVTEVGGKKVTFLEKGEVRELGLMKSMVDYEGAPEIGGRKVQMKAVSAKEIQGFEEFVNSNPALKKLREQNPQEFWRMVMEEYGYTQTALMAAGFRDGHGGNVWAMVMRISEADAKYMESLGHVVMRDGEGPMILKFGRIDTDAGGTFVASQKDGQLRFGGQFVEAAGKMDTSFNVFLRMQGSDFAGIGAGPNDNFNRSVSAAREGGQKWVNEVGKTKEYQQRTEKVLEDNMGASIGIGVTLKVTENDKKVIAEIRGHFERGEKPPESLIKQLSDDVRQLYDLDAPVSIFKHVNGVKYMPVDANGRTMLTKDAVRAFQEFRKILINDPEGVAKIWDSIRWDMTDDMAQDIKMNRGSKPPYPNPVEARHDVIRGHAENLAKGVPLPAKISEGDAVIATALAGNENFVKGDAATRERLAKTAIEIEGGTKTLYPTPSPQERASILSAAVDLYDAAMSNKPLSALPEEYKVTVKHMGVEKPLVQAIRDEGEAGRGLAAAGFARDILQKKAAGQSELDVKLAALPREVADDAKIIYKAMDGKELSQSETKRLLSMPDEVHAKIRPGMTADEVISVAKELHQPPPAEPVPQPVVSGPKLPEGVSRQSGGVYTHENIPGRAFADINVQNAEILVGLAGDISKGKTVPPGPLGVVAENLANNKAFSAADPKAKVAMALAALDNAPMLQGDLNVMARHNVSGNFRSALGAEIGKASGDSVVVSGRFDPNTGLFTTFGKGQGAGREVELRVDLKSGKITSITAPGGESIHPAISAMLGFKVLEPSAGPSGAGTPKGPSPKPSKPPPTEAQHRTNMESQRLIYLDAASTLHKEIGSKGQLDPKMVERYARSGREKRAQGAPLNELERAALAYDEIPRQYGLQKEGPGDAVALRHVNEKAQELAKAGGRAKPNEADYATAAAEVAKMRVEAAGSVTDMAGRYAAMKPAEAKSQEDRVFVAAMDAHIKANPKATRQEAALAVANDIIGEALIVGAHSRKPSENPQQSLDTVAYVLAQAKAAKEGRFIPSTEDYAYGILSKKAAEDLVAGRRKATTPEDRALLALVNETKAGDFAGAARIAKSIAEGAKMKEPVRGVLATRKEETRVTEIFEDKTRSKTRREDGATAFLELEGKSQEKVLGRLEKARKKNADRAAQLDKEIADLTKKGGELQAKGKGKEAQKVLDEIIRKGDERNALLKEASRMESDIRYLQELQLVSGRAGYDIERVYGLRPGELSEIYSKAKSLKDARETMMSRLGIVAMVPADKHIDLMGMITSGDLLGAIARKYDGGRVTGISFSSGAEGAFKISIIEPNGRTHVEYAKKLDMRPDAGGAADLIRSGVPAPDVTTYTIIDGKKVDLVYTKADGSESRFGMVRSIAEFEGKIKIGDREMNVRAVDEAAFMDIMSKPEFMDLLMKDPQAFWREFWFSVTAEYAVGSHDGHEVNRRILKLEILEPLSPKEITDLEAQGYKVKAEKVKATPQDIAAFEKAGHRVTVDADGNYTRYSVIKVGRIDTDAAASYLAIADGSGGFDLSAQKWKYGSNDLYRLMEDVAMQKTLYMEFQKSGQWKFEVNQEWANNLLRNRNANVTEVNGRYYVETKDVGVAVTLYRNHFDMPGVKKVTVAELRAESIKGGALEQGVSMFQRQFSGDPRYQGDVLGAYQQRAGEPMGMGIRISDPAKLAVIAEGGMVNDPWRLQFNGEPVRPISHADGRSTMRPEYEGFSITNMIPDQRNFYERFFPDKKEVYVVPLKNAAEAKLAKGGAVFNVGGQNFAVFASTAAIPKAFAGRKPLWVKRDGENIRTETGFRRTTGILTVDLGPSNVFKHIMDPRKTDLVKDIQDVAKDIKINDDAIHGTVPVINQDSSSGPPSGGNVPQGGKGTIVPPSSGQLKTQPKRGTIVPPSSGEEVTRTKTPNIPPQSESGIPVSSGDILTQPKGRKPPSGSSIPVEISDSFIQVSSKPKPSGAVDQTKFNEALSAIEIVAGLVPADAAMVEAAGKKLASYGAASPEFAGRVKLASPEERAILAEALAGGKSPDEAFGALARKTLPKTKDELLALEKRIDSLKAAGDEGKAEAKRRIKELNAVQDKFEYFLAFLKYPESRERILAKFEEAQKARADNDAAYEATLRKNSPEDHNKRNNKALDSDTLKGITGRRGGAVKPEDVRKAYALHPDSTGLRADELDSAREGALKALGIKADPNQDVFNLVFVADVEGHIRGITDAEGKPLYQNAVITKIENMGGTTGAYRVEFNLTTSRGTEKRSIIIKQVDGRADALGAGAVKEAGLVPQKVHPADRAGKVFSYETGVSYENPPGTVKQVTKQFTIIEDVHDYALRGPSGKRQEVEMVIDGKTETVPVEAVSLLTTETMVGLGLKTRMDELGATALRGRSIEQMLSTPEGVKEVQEMLRSPAGRKELEKMWGERTDQGNFITMLETPDGRARLLQLARGEDPVVSKMAQMMATPDGRKKLMQRWTDYQDMARLGLLSDRFARNTAVFLVERNGQMEITFQPIDTDPVGLRLYNKIDEANKRTQTEFSEFDKDFAKGTTNFLTWLSKASGQDYKALVREMRDLLVEVRGTGDAPVPVPSELQKRAARVKAYYEDPKHAGSPVGNAIPMARDLGYKIGNIDAAVDPTGLAIIQTQHRQALLDADNQKGLSGLVGQTVEQANRQRYLDMQIAALNAELGQVAQVPKPPPLPGQKAKPPPLPGQKKVAPPPLPLTAEQYQKRVDGLGMPNAEKNVEDHFQVQKGKIVPNATVLDNAMIIMGDRKEGRAGVTGSLLESFAAREDVKTIRTPDGRLVQAKILMAHYDPATMRIVAFGQKGPEGSKTILINVEITGPGEGRVWMKESVMPGEKSNAQLEALNGMKVTLPTDGNPPPLPGRKGPPPLPQGPKKEGAKVIPLAAKGEGQKPKAQGIELANEGASEQRGQEVVVSADQDSVSVLGAPPAKEGEGAKVIPFAAKGKAEGQKGQAEGIALAKELKLNEDAGRAAFVERLAKGDAKAKEQLEQLPIDETSKKIIRNEAARAEKFRNRNKTIHDQAVNNVHAALKEGLPKEVNEQVRQAAVGAEEPQMIGKPPEVIRPSSAVQQGDVPMAMKGDKGQKPFKRKVEPGWIDRGGLIRDEDFGGGVGEVKKVAAKPEPKVDETKAALDGYIAEYDKSDAFEGMDKLQKAKMVRTLALVRLAQKRASEKYGQEIKVLLVGGSVRDMARGKAPNDLDIVVSQGEALFYQELKKVYLEVEGRELAIKKLGIATAEEAGEYAPDVKKAKDVADEAKRKGAIVEVRLLWGPGKHYEKGVGPDLPEVLFHDANARDLTVNSMYVDLDNVSKAGIIDPTGSGLADIRDNTIRFTDMNKKRMKAIIDGAEPSVNIIYRIFRAYDMAARMGAKMEPETKLLIRQLVEASQNNPKLKECMEMGLRRALTEGTLKAPGILRGLQDDGLMVMMPKVEGTVNPVLREIGQNDLKALVDFFEGRKTLDELGAMVGNSAFNGALYDVLSRHGVGTEGAAALFDLVGRNALTMESASELLSAMSVKDAKMARVIIELTKERIGPENPQYSVLEAMSSALDPLMVREIDNAAIAAAKKAIEEKRIAPADFEKEKARAKRELFAQAIVPVTD